MSSDFRQAVGSKKGDANSSQSSSFQGAREEMIKQIKDKIEKELKPEFQEKIESDVKKEVKKGEIDKTFPTQNSRENKINEIKKEATRKAQKPLERESIPYKPVRGWTGKMHDSNLSEQKNREIKINAIREEARDEAQKEIEKASKDIYDAKTRAILKLSGDHLDRVAYFIAQKMAKEANRGGIHAIIPIGLTYLIALVKDLLDFTGIGAVAGIVTGILAGAIIALFWVQVSGGWKGGLVTRILIKKIIIKLGLAAFIETLPGPNLIPTFLVMNLWSHLDFARSVKKSKSDLADFKSDYKNKRRIRKSIYNQYVS